MFYAHEVLQNHKIKCYLFKFGHQNAKTNAVNKETDNILISKVCWNYPFFVFLEHSSQQGQGNQCQTPGVKFEE